MVIYIRSDAGGFSEVWAGGSSTGQLPGVIPPRRLPAQANAVHVSAASSLKQGNTCSLSWEH